MNILEISSLQEVTPPQGYGGTERFVHWLSEAFQETDHKVSVICKHGSIGGEYTTIYTEKDTLKETVKSYLENNNVDIIHLNIKDITLLEYLKSTKYKVVITLHNNFRHTSSWVNVIKDNNPNFYFTTISENLKKRVLDALEFNAVVVPTNGVTNLGFGMPLTNNVTKGIRKYFLYLGVLARYKGVLDIVKAFTKTDNQLLLVGPCNDISEKEYLNEILEYTKRNINIKYYGVTKDSKEKSKIISNAKALIVATGYDPQESDCYEAFGLVMLEANTLGVPVIGYSKGNVEDYIEEGVNGYKFHDISQLPGLITKIEEGNLSKTCIFTAQKYNISKIATQYLDFFKNILS